MSLEKAIEALIADEKLKTLVVFVAIDFVIGVAAAVSSGNLRLSYLADVMKNDVLGKLVPWGRPLHREQARR